MGGIAGELTLRGPTIFFVLIALSFLPRRAVSCSMIGCTGDGEEMRHNFTVKMVRDGRPLTGVTVGMARTGEGGDEKFFLGTTGPDGLLRITNLPHAHNWIYTDILWLRLGTNRFHHS